MKHLFVKKILCFIALLVLIISVYSCQKDLSDKEPRKSQIFSVKFIVKVLEKGKESSIAANYSISIDDKFYSKGEFIEGDNTLEFGRVFYTLKLTVDKAGYDTFVDEFDFNELLQYRNKSVVVMLTKTIIPDPKPNPNLDVDYFLGSNEDDEACKILKCGDDFLIAGTYIFGSEMKREIHLIKINSKAEILFDKKLELKRFGLVDIKPYSDGFCLLVDSYNKSGLIFVDKNANIISTCEFARKTSTYNSTLLIGDDNSFYAIGKDFTYKKDDDIAITKISSEGKIFFTKHIGDEAAKELPYSAIINSNGDIFIAGVRNTIDKSDADAFLLKMNKEGIVIFNKTYGDDDKEEFFTSLIERDNKIYCAGTIAPSTTDGSDNCLLYVLNEDGELDYKKVVVGPSNEIVKNISFDNDGNILLLGSTYVDSKSTQAMIFKLSSNGERIAQKFVGGAKEDEAISGVHLSGDFYIILSNSKSTENEKQSLWVNKLSIN